MSKKSKMWVGGAAVAVVIIIATLLFQLRTSGQETRIRRSESAFWDEILHATNARGVNSISQPVVILGANSSIGNNDETLWPLGGFRPQPTVEVFLEVLSDSPNDALAGTGTQVLNLTGLDINGVVVPQLISMNGTTPVVVPIGLFRIQPSGNAQVGSLRGNDGTIIIRGIGGGITYDIVNKTDGGISRGSTQSAMFTIPTGKVFFADHVFYGTNEQAIATFTIDDPVVGIRSFESTIQGQEQVRIKLCYSSGTEIEIRARAITGLIRINASLYGYLVTKASGLCK